MKYEKMRELVPEQKKTRPNDRTNITDYGDFSVCTNEKKGLVFIVDSDIAKSIQHRSWCNSQGYVASRVGGELIRLHDYVMSTIAAEKPEGCYVDHINQDKRDNRRTNLRFVSPTESSKNMPLRSNNKSGYVGVAKIEGGKRYRAYITVDGKQKNLGHYDTAEEAHQARMEAEERLGFLTRSHTHKHTIAQVCKRRLTPEEWDEERRERARRGEICPETKENGEKVQYAEKFLAEWKAANMERL